MANQDLLSVFLLGLLGTGHCIGMCGPLVVAFPGRSGRLLPHGGYHLGRVITYAAVGLMMGAAGRGLTDLAGALGADPLVWLARAQVTLSLAAALFLLIFGLMRLELIPEPRRLSLASPALIPGHGRLLAAARAEPSSGRMLTLGLMLGLLPCGLSYAAFARALAAGGAGAGALLTLAFGMGTVPGLMLMGTGAAVVARRYRRQSDLLAGMLMVYMALSLAAEAISAQVG